MYFINSGECRVKVRDHNGRQLFPQTDESNGKILEAGDHFGEISLIYPTTQRTATIISTNYNTFARILRKSYVDVISDFPEYETCLKNHIIQAYRDKRI